eukprot:2627535-Rhodomonas_salina.2
MQTAVVVRLHAYARRRSSQASRSCTALETKPELEGRVCWGRTRSDADLCAGLHGVGHKCGEDHGDGGRFLRPQHTLSGPGIASRSKRVQIELWYVPVVQCGRRSGSSVA